VADTLNPIMMVKSNLKALNSFNNTMSMKSKINWADDYDILEGIDGVKNLLISILSTLRRLERRQDKPNKGLIKSWSNRAIEIRDISTLKMNFSTQADALKYIDSLYSELEVLRKKENTYKNSAQPEHAH
jgi:hypothetical protein